MSGFLNAAGKLWKLTRMIEDLIEGHRDTNAAIQAIGGRLRALEDRMTHMEANQGQVITEARAAAGAASTAATGGVLAEAFTRLTRLEVQVEKLPSPETSRRLEAPDKV